MSVPGAVSTRQPNNLFESILERINKLPDADGQALVPVICNVPTEEDVIWTYCSNGLDAVNHSSILARLFGPGIGTEATKRMVSRYVLQNLPAHLTTPTKSSRGHAGGPLAEILGVLQRQVQQYATHRGVIFIRYKQRRKIHNHEFMKEILGL
jgi:hypothetical protein